MEMGTGDPNIGLDLCYVVSVFHILDPPAGTGNTGTTDLKCIFVVLYGILAIQNIQSSSTPLGCMGRGKKAVLLESSGGAGFITAWEVVAASDNSADI